MKISRRNFFKISGIAASAGLVQTAFGQNFSAGDYGQTAQIWQIDHSLNSFGDNIGSEFYLSNEKTMLSAVLIKASNSFNVKTGKSPSGQIRRAGKSAENYVLTFRAQSECPQDTYQIAHSRLGSFDLFLVPGKSDNGENMIHAVINRL